ncbi:MAG: hypothetical protein ACTHNY_06090 [Solirubrobacterales bacterium]
MSADGDLERKFWSSLEKFVRRRFLSWLPVICFIVGLAAGWFFAPGHQSLEDHAWFSGFFGTSAQVIATLFVGYALGARFYLASVRVAIITLLLVGVSEIAAVTALSPSLPTDFYAPLMGVTIGGGIGSLVAALLSAMHVVVEERHAREQEGLKALN